MAVSHEQMKKMLDHYQTMEDMPWATQKDYDKGLMRSMQDELQHYWKFQTWLRFTHPEVIDEFKAIEDIKRSANG